MDQIPWAAIGALTPSGMLMLAVWLILTGRIVPKSTYEVMVKARDDWQSTAQKKQEIIHTLAETVREQSVVSQTAAKVMTAVQEANQAGDTP
ncbi:hypothetical protein [Glutamicibacter protophormiae]|uniref:hypothetical protein n=1 Tax=Glutamicibacter protophormiae TaxID=37930 RepID=UPI0019568BD1|nr:hypothetical protein [Glutamicibacter protophormiae]QRQ79185.1 hypothetical protein JQN66_02710 [Glutamicibacter protophormiae]